METLMERLVIPVLINLVVVLIFPDTLITKNLPQNGLEDLEILEKVNATLTHKDQALLYCVFVQFHDCTPDSARLDSPSFADSINWEFQDFAFHGLMGPTRNQFLEDVVFSFSSMERERIYVKDVGDR